LGGNRSAPATSLCAYLQAIGAVFAEAEELIETVLAPPREVKLIGTD
jgi:GntR family transcriptional regulator